MAVFCLRRMTEVNPALLFLSTRLVYLTHFGLFDTFQSKLDVHQVKPTKNHQNVSNKPVLGSGISLQASLYSSG